MDPRKDIQLFTGVYADADQRRLMEYDKESKKQSGKSPERIMTEADVPFQYCFGEDALMKAAIELVTHAEGVTKWKISQLCFQIAEQEYIRKRGGEEIKSSEVQQKIVREVLEKLGIKDIIVGDEFSSQGRQDDNLLNIGDPFLKLNQLFDSPRITTIDYEWGVERENEIETRHSAISEMKYEVSNILMELNRGGHDIPSEFIEGEDGIRGTLEELTRLLEEHEFTDQPLMTLAEINEKMKQVRGKLYEATCKVPELRRGATPFRDTRLTREDYFNLIDEYKAKGMSEEAANKAADADFDKMEANAAIFKGAFYSVKAEQKISAQCIYEEFVFPEIIHRNIEEIMENHIKSISQSANGDSVLLSHQAAWQRFLTANGVDNWDPYKAGAVELVAAFYMQNGMAGLGCVNKELAEDLGKKKREAMYKLHPQENPSGEAEAKTMMFPYTQELPTGKFDRILASWSFSTYMMMEMDQTFMEERVWPELERLMSEKGVAVIFPIDKFIHVKEGKVMPPQYEMIDKSFAEYVRKTGSKMTHFYHDSPDDQHEATVLVLSKSETEENLNWWTIGN